MGQADIFLRVVFLAMGLLFAGVFLLFSSPSNAEQQIDISRLNNAAALGEVDALVGLGGLYLNGKIVPKNPEKAAQLFLKAARKGDVEAMQIVAGLYSDGTGVEKDLNEAFVWMTMAAEYGSSFAQVMAGKYNFWGIGDIPPDKEEAVRWWKMAAGNGEHMAQSMLSACYFYGDGVERDIEEAYFWALAASEKNDPVRQEFRGFVEEQLTKNQKENVIARYIEWSAKKEHK